MQERKAFEKDPEVQRQIDALLKRLKDVGRNGTLPYHEVEHVMEADRESNRGRYVQRRATERLLEEYRIATRPEVGVGIRLLTETEQVERCAVDRQRRALRQTRKGLDEVSCVQTGNLSLHHRKLQAMSIQGMQDRQKEQASELRRFSRERKQEVMPKRPEVVQS